MNNYHLQQLQEPNRVKPLFSRNDISLPLTAIFFMQTPCTNPITDYKIGVNFFFL